MIDKIRHPALGEVRQQVDIIAKNRERGDAEGLLPSPLGEPRPHHLLELLARDVEVLVALAEG
eukprot:5502649-Alexandrium_andersonii.AAC.1